ncbi:MAG: efflux transporter outer membrane subunit [Acidiferrobacterales bacterium]
MQRVLTASLIGATLSACAVGPRFAPPHPVVPARFAAAPENAPPAWPDRDWWRKFGSPDLDQLITEAEVHNFSVRIAVAQLQAANAQARIAGAPLLPSLGANGSATDQRYGKGVAVSGVPAANSPYINTHQFAASLQVSYELDFWGKNRDALRAAEANAAASRFNRDTVALTAVSAVATTWFQILADRDRLLIANRNLAAAESLLAQLRAQLRAGIVDAGTVAQQAALVAGERATIPSLRSQLRQQEIALGILVGKPPELLKLAPATLDSLHIPPLMPGLPSALLGRRPDIAQAEAVLIAANANVRGAIAAYFPSISLTGSGGWQSTALNGLFTPSSELLSATASLAQPLFEGGALSGQLAVSRATYRQDVAVYEETTVKAFSDVETALTALHFATEQEQEERIAVDRARIAFHAVEAQLNAGTVSIGSVLTAQQTLLGDQDSLEQARLARFLAAVNLYEALGGGWHVPSQSLLVGG